MDCKAEEVVCQDRRRGQLAVCKGVHLPFAAPSTRQAPALSAGPMHKKELEKDSGVRPLQNPDEVQRNFRGSSTSSPAITIHNISRRVVDCCDLFPSYHWKPVTIVWEEEEQKVKNQKLIEQSLRNLIPTLFEEGLKNFQLPSRISHDRIRQKQTQRKIKTTTNVYQTMEAVPRNKIPTSSNMRKNLQSCKLTKTTLATRGITQNLGQQYCLPRQHQAHRDIAGTTKSLRPPPSKFIAFLKPTLVSATIVARQYPR